MLSFLFTDTNVRMTLYAATGQYIHISVQFRFCDSSRNSDVTVFYYMIVNKSTTRSHLREFRAHRE